MATIFKLIIEDDEGKTTVYPLADGDVSIGRKEGNTIRLMERNVSRHHACLKRSNGTIYIEDLDSYNGIRINGERIDGRYEVKEGDLVEIGDYHLALQRTEVEDAPEEAKSPQKKGTWPAAGTVPDFQLPDEILAETQPPTQQASARDTIIDEPVPAGLPGAVAQTLVDGGPQPRVKPPQRDANGASGPAAGSNGAGSLPPFPTPGAFGPGQGAQGAPGGVDGVVPPMADEASTKALKVGPAYVSSVPRLVCVSTSYAGKEFALTRPELIIGRVEDNDIVIEHRSVSRNHAKILYDGRTHKIIDLQSANGILVNGEEYAMTDLRTGDLIELGHVRFRFVPADEPFEPNDEEAREMREAGVEPPVPTKGATKDASLAAPQVAGNLPNEVGGYDPSTAATVTDTPLSALNVDEMLSPKVEAGAPGLPAPSAPSKPAPAVQAKAPPERSGPAPAASPPKPADAGPAAIAPKPKPKAAVKPSSKGHPPASRSAPTRPTDTNKPKQPKRATEDQKPTEVNHHLNKSGSSPAPLIASEPTARESYPKPRPESLPAIDPGGGKSKLGMLAIAVVAFGVLTAVGVFSFMGGNSQLDDQLKKKHDGGDYRGCVMLFERVMEENASFDKPGRALRLYNACKKNCTDCPDPQSKAPKKDDELEATAAKLPSGDPVDPVDPEEGAEPEKPAQTEEAADLVKGTKGPEEAKEVAAKPTKPRKRSPAVDRRRRWREARRIANEVRADFLKNQVDLSQIDAKLKKCRRLSRKQPDCLLMSGTYFNQVGQKKKAQGYFKDFLAAAPNHRQAPIVRNQLKADGVPLARSP